MWKVSVDTPTRDSWVLAGLALALSVAGVLGLWLARRRDPRMVASLASLGLLGLLLAWLPTTGPGADLVEWTVTTVPGAGLLRDSQKWVALTVLATCWGLSRNLDVLLSRTVAGAKSLAVGAVLLPLAVLPGLAWGLLGTLTPVAYPDEWETVRTILDEQADSRMVVLPFDIYRRFAWNDDQALLDPAQRYFPGQIVTDDALEVTEGTVSGESRTARRIDAAADDPEALARVLAEEDVRWLLIEKGTPGADVVPDIVGTVVHDGPELQLVDLGHSSEPRTASHAALILGMDLVVLGGSLLACAMIMVRRWHGYTARRLYDNPVGGN